MKDQAVVSFLAPGETSKIHRIHRYWSCRRRPKGIRYRRNIYKPWFQSGKWFLSVSLSLARRVIRNYTVRFLLPECSFPRSNRLYAGFPRNFVSVHVYKRLSTLSSLELTRSAAGGHVARINFDKDVPSSSVIGVLNAFTIRLTRGGFLLERTGRNLTSFVPFLFDRS